MGLLTAQPQVLPRMPQQMPGMPGGLPNFQAQPTPGPRMGQTQAFMPQQQGAPAFTLPQFDASQIPRYGHGYEGGGNLTDMGRMQSVNAALRPSLMPVPMGPWSLAGQRTTYADMPGLINGAMPHMNGDMPVTWYAEDWKRGLPD